MGGRDKGNGAEIEVAKLLEPWWRALEPAASFCRTPLSGGWGSPTLRVGFRASGDLMTTAKKFPFTVEVKRREGWAVQNLVDGKKSPVWEWWRQAQGQAMELGAVPMLWVRKNRMASLSGATDRKPRWLVLIPEAYAIDRRMRGAVLSWTWTSLSSVDYGDAFPIAYEHPTILSMSPRSFVSRVAA